MDRQQLAGYFDYNATTPVSPAVAEAMTATLGQFANASSNHAEAIRNRNAMQQARVSVAEMLGTSVDKVFFTSGGSEANNWAIKGRLFNHLNKPGHIITTAIEHPSVLETVRYFEKQFGFKVSYLKPQSNGAISISGFMAALQEDTQLVSMMYANNETGVIQPISEVAKITSARGIKLHVDGVQLVGKRAIDVEACDIDYLSFSAHKFYGPKGVGGLYIKENDSLSPLIHGGGQELGLRSGTENLLAISGLSKAAEEAKCAIAQWDQHAQACKHLMVDLIQQADISVEFNGDTSHANALSNTLNMAIKGVRGEALAVLMDKKHGFIISIGSACSNNKQKMLSPVLLAMGLDEERIQSSIRVSFGQYTTTADIENFVTALNQCVKQLSAMSFAS